MLIPCRVMQSNLLKCIPTIQQLQGIEVEYCRTCRCPRDGSVQWQQKWCLQAQLTGLHV